ncbi:hypothetical protein PsorP6_011650 [Peronosclerospora sorghi]|uniref:Uncharacterized protein n=1 Tax=Peronosclerospora sorghi TaxID=230839 RepID=A0ACC0WKV7_9STRA|nr:hypothetical protein PsorP6_011650 [Peronosclerospora sorghi]
MGNVEAKGVKGNMDELRFDESNDEAFTQVLRVNLQRLIVYARSADASLQREVAEKLANEAVKRTCLDVCISSRVPSIWFCTADRQVQIVELDGLQLLLPLTKSKDTEVQRLAAHALANLSVNCKGCCY